MIVFVLYLHVCTTQLTSMHGGAPARVVTACSQEARPKLYATQALCETDGKAALSPPPPEGPSIDAYQCRSQPVASK